MTMFTYAVLYTVTPGGPINSVAGSAASEAGAVQRIVDLLQWLDTRQVASLETQIKEVCYDTH